MKRIDFIKRTTLFGFGAILPGIDLMGLAGRASRRLTGFYTGSYTPGGGPGIRFCRMDPETGALSVAGTYDGGADPSFLIMGKSGKYLYSVSEVADYNGERTGSVVAFRADPKRGALIRINAVSSGGAHPCHLAMDKTGKYIIVANYTGGTIAVIPLIKSGGLGEPVDIKKHSGQGADPARQEGPHAHSATFSPENRFVFACDLGIDRIMIYLVDQKSGKLTPAHIPFFQTAPGAGPRHFTFAPGGKQAYVANELNSTVTSFEYQPDQLILKELQTLSTLPAGFTGENTCADVHVHPGGKFVYVSNRGHDSIAVFGIKKGTDKLELIQNQPALGRTPRNFTITRDGQFLLAANQNSDNIVVFRVDPMTGMLAETGQGIAVPKPVCIRMAED